MGIKRCIILAVLLPILLVSACLPSSLVSAVSDYDNAYQTTGSLKLKMNGVDADHSLDWASYTKSLLKNQDDKDYIDAVLGDPDHNSWYVSQQGYGLYADNDTKSIIINMCKGKLKLFWTTSFVASDCSTNDYRSFVLLINGNGAPYVQVGRFASSDDGYISGQYTRNFIVSGFVDYNYPVGYAGPQVNSSAPTLVKPKVSWDVSRKDITLRFEPIQISDDYKYLFAIKRLGDVGGDLVEVSKGKEITEQIVEKNGTARVTVDSFGTYILGVWVVPADFSRDEPEYRFVKNTESFWVDLDIDGSFFSGSSFDKDSYKNCTTDNINGQEITRCESRFLKDCPLDADHSIATFVGCQVNNFFTILTSLFKSLFIPDLSDMMSVLNSFLDFIHNKLGFIYDSVAVVGSFFGSIISNAFKPDCVLHYGVIQGNDTSLNVCQFRNTIGAQAFDFVINIIRGTTVILFLFLAYHFLTRFLNGNNEVDPV